MSGIINEPRGNRLHRREGPSGEPLPVLSSAAATCPVETAIEAIGGRWKLLVLRALFIGGAQRFNQLRHAVGKISAKELTRNLRELENTGLIERGAGLCEDAAFQSYGLSELGLTLLQVFTELGDFGERLRISRIALRGSRAGHAES